MARMPRWTEEMISELIRLEYEEKLTHEEIAEILGKSRETITQKLYNLRLKGVVE